MHSKREKIIVVLAALSLLYGVYAYVLQPRHKGRQQEQHTASAPVAPWLQAIRDTLTGTSVSPLQGLVVEQALAPWPDQLILDKPLPSELLDAEKRRIEEQEKAALAAQAERERALKAQKDEKERREMALRALRKRFVYSGYAVLDNLEGHPPCAVVNSIVYRVGETLEGSPYLVKSITPEEVVIALPEQTIEVHIPITE